MVPRIIKITKRSAIRGLHCVHRLFLQILTYSQFAVFFWYLHLKECSFNPYAYMDYYEAYTYFGYFSDYYAKKDHSSGAYIYKECASSSDTYKECSSSSYDYREFSSSSYDYKECSFVLSRRQMVS
jgi:hypothetical protein